MPNSRIISRPKAILWFPNDSYACCCLRALFYSQLGDRIVLHPAPVRAAGQAGRLPGPVISTGGCEPQSGHGCRDVGTLKVWCAWQEADALYCVHADSHCALQPQTYCQMPRPTGGRCTWWSVVGNVHLWSIKCVKILYVLFMLAHWWCLIETWTCVNKNYQVCWPWCFL